MTHRRISKLFTCQNNLSEVLCSQGVSGIWPGRIEEFCSELFFFCAIEPHGGGGLLFHASWTAHPWSQKLRMSWITHKRHFRKGNQIYLSPELMHENIILLWIWYFTFYGRKKTKSGRHIVSYHIPETLGIKYSSKPPPPKIPALFRCIKRL